jgi:SOS-response transcriptional repressor LexA
MARNFPLESIVGKALRLGDCEVLADNSLTHHIVRGGDMDGEDGYCDGDMVVIDATRDAISGNDVLVLLPNKQLLFRRLLKDEQGSYLIAIKTNATVRLPDGAFIFGVAVLSGRVR